ncbi:MAG: hypothetical protein VYA30_11315 [Myxococcota bacterium]|nr:hypothetical protein [Myxococcota bacterium]
MAIILRILFVGLVLTLIVLIVQKIRGPKALRIPRPWRRLAKRHDDLSQALRLRTEIFRILLKTNKKVDGPVPEEVDGIIDAMVLLATTRERQGVYNQTDELAQSALDELKNVYLHFLNNSNIEDQNRMDLVRENLKKKTDELKSNSGEHTAD